ncbi:thioredoxin 1 [Gammaproteobacteria bacterium]|nr:thioredoxin 1 [Gammaproteobacteria bacterium]
MSNLINATDTSFDVDVLQAELPVLVDFWAEWCGPCKAIGPIIVDAATEYAGKLKVVKFDVQANQQTSVKYRISGIPALMIFKNGQVHAQHVGLLNKGQLKLFIESNI